MRKESKHSTLDDGTWAATVTVVPGPVNGKWREFFWFLLNHFVVMVKIACFIIHEDGKCYHGYYDILHYTIGYIVTAQ